MYLTFTGHTKTSKTDCYWVLQNNEYLSECMYYTYHSCSKAWSMHCWRLRCAPSITSTSFLSSASTGSLTSSLPRRPSLRVKHSAVTSRGRTVAARARSVSSLDLTMIYGFMNTLEIFFFCLLEDTFFLNCIIYLFCLFFFYNTFFSLWKKNVYWSTFYKKRPFQSFMFNSVCYLRFLYSNFWMKIVSTFSTT